MPFLPGHSGNPTGRKPLQSDLRNVRKIKKDELEARVARVLRMDREQMKIAQEDPTTDVLDALIISIAIKGVCQGDSQRLEFLMRFLISKTDWEAGPTKSFDDMKRARLDLIPREKLVQLVKDAEKEAENEDV